MEHCDRLKGRGPGALWPRRGERPELREPGAVVTGGGPKYLGGSKYIYIHICMYMYTSMYVYRDMYIYIDADMNAHLYMYMCLYCICMYTYVFMWICMHNSYMYICITHTCKCDANIGVTLGYLEPEGQYSRIRSRTLYLKGLLGPCYQNR